MNCANICHSLVLIPFVLWESCNAFHFESNSILFSGNSVSQYKFFSSRYIFLPRPPIVLYGDIFPDENDEYEDDDLEPGKMRVAEIKAELVVRNIPHSDCFDKESLVQRLIKARKEGIADLAILDKFNKERLERAFRGESLETTLKNLENSDFDSAVANDGTIPGGLTPEMFKKLIGNPEIVASLSSTKMQDAMKLVMTGNQRELEKRMEKDIELREMFDKIESVMILIGLEL